MKIEVTLTKEQYEAFGNGKSITLLPPKLPPKKDHVIEYDKAFRITCIDDETIKRYNDSGKSYDVCEGVLRKTKENANYSHKRNQRANRLEALVEDLQGELGTGDYVVYEIDNGYRANEATYFNVGDVRMNRTTAEKVCELLNSGQYSLEG